jgi:hypothetical protein
MSRYNQTLKTLPPSGKQMYRTVKYPQISKSFEDIYVYTTVGDRFDTLALQYYNDSSLWWIISIANNELYQNSIIPPLGSQIRIPTNVSQIIENYNNLNK